MGGEWVGRAIWTRRTSIGWMNQVAFRNTTDQFLNAQNYPRKSSLSQIRLRIDTMHAIAKVVLDKHAQYSIMFVGEQA